MWTHWHVSQHMDSTPSILTPHFHIASHSCWLYQFMHTSHSCGFHTSTYLPICRLDQFMSTYSTCRSISKVPAPEVPVPEWVPRSTDPKSTGSGSGSPEVAVLTHILRHTIVRSIIWQMECKATYNGQIRITLIRECVISATMPQLCNEYGCIFRYP